MRLPYNLPSFSQAAALVALTHRDQLLAAIPQIIAERDKLLATLSEHPWFTGLVECCQFYLYSPSPTGTK